MKAYQVKDQAQFQKPTFSQLIPAYQIIDIIKILRWISLLRTIYQVTFHKKIKFIKEEKTQGFQILLKTKQEWNGIKQRKIYDISQQNLVRKALRGEEEDSDFDTP